MKCQYLLVLVLVLSLRLIQNLGVVAHLGHFLGFHPQLTENLPLNLLWQDWILVQKGQVELLEKMELVG